MSSVIRDAIDKLLEMNNTISLLKGEPDGKDGLLGRLYSKDKLNRIPLPQESRPDELLFTTLKGLTAFASRLASSVAKEQLYFHIESPESVSLLGEIQPANFNKRFCYATASLGYTPFKFSTIEIPRYIDIEMMVIALQSLFVISRTREDIINVIGNLANEKIVTNKDDRFSQGIRIRSGISGQSEVTVENPVCLKPHRTFPECDQPESDFVLRYREGRQGSLIECALFEADGSQWRHAAMMQIAEVISISCNESQIPAIVIY
jgi:hypothetical protein